MRLGGRLAAAIEVLDDIERRHRPAADALRDWGLSHRFAGAGDRAAIGNLVYDALRRRRSTAWMFDAETSRAQVFGALLLEWKEKPQAINAALAGDRFAPQPLDGSEIAAFLAHDPAAAPAAVRADCPDWCAPLLAETFGDDWVEEGRALADRPPLDLRVNTLLAERDRVLEELRDTQPEPTRLAAAGIRIAPIAGGGRHPNVQAEPAFRKGWFEVQDEGSQVVSTLAGAEPGMQVLDYCAGAGGKTLAFAAAMQNRGQIFAYDAEKARLAPIFDRLKRAETRNVQVLSRVGDLETLNDSMDLVLVDAPCTGSGTWRRRPDAKWRLSRKQLETRKAEQDRVLSQAADHVKLGGRLAYVTCSVFREENQDRVAAFLESRPDFSLLDHAALFEATFPGRGGEVRIADRGIMLSPSRTGTDGFFFAALTRAT